MSSMPRVLARLRWLICVAFLLCLPGTLQAATGRVECNSLPSKFVHRAVAYCVMLPPSFDAGKTRHFPILYLLHGLGDNEQFFIHSGEWNLVEDLREKGELQDFLIATPEGRASFYINAKDGKERYEDFLVQEFFPFIEKHYRVSPGRANRAISGISMGGFGALHLAFRHPQLFFRGQRAQRRADREVTGVSWRNCSARQPAKPRANFCGRTWQPARRGLLESSKPNKPGANRESGGVKDLFRLRRPG
jgi:hypothetical protein